MSLILKNSYQACKIIAFLFFCIGSSTAQKFEFGLKYSPTFSKFDVRAPSGSIIIGEINYAFGMGGQIAFHLTNHLGVQGEVIYNSVFQKFKEGDADYNLRVKYLNIPLLLSLNSGKSNLVNVNAVVGPQIGVNVGSNVSIKTSGTTNNGSILSVKKVDLGFAYGIGLDFGLKTSLNARLLLGYRGVLGLIDISNQNKNTPFKTYYLLDKTYLKTQAGYIGISLLF